MGEGRSRVSDLLWFYGVSSPYCNGETAAFVDVPLPYRTVPYRTTLGNQHLLSFFPFNLLRIR